MPRQVRMLDIFLSSPSDVDDERQFILEAARDWNALRSHQTGTFLNILTWEDAVAPRLSDRAQTVINDEIGDTYDVYLGLMWGRFGTPTGVADSGTVEEFERALDRYRSGDTVRLAMLFKTNDIPLAHLDGAQFDKVKEFKKRFAAEGGMYGEFSDDDRLRKILNRLFEDIVASHSEPDGPLSASDDEIRPAPSAGGVERTKRSRKKESPSRGELTAAPGEIIDDDKQDIGLFEITERLTQVALAQGTFFEDLTKIHTESNSVINKASEEIDGLVSFGKADPTQLKRIVARVSQTLKTSSSFLEDRLPGFIAGNEDLIDLTERGLDVSMDFGPSNDSALQLREAVTGVAITFNDNKSKLEELMATIETLPRMSTDFNRARKGVISQYRILRNETDRLQSALHYAVEKYAFSIEV